MAALSDISLLPDDVIKNLDFLILFPNGNGNDLNSEDI